MPTQKLPERSMQTQSASQKIQGWAFRNPAMILFCRYRVRNQYLRVRTAALHHLLRCGARRLLPRCAARDRSKLNFSTNQATSAPLSPQSTLTTSGF